MHGATIKISNNLFTAYQVCLNVKQAVSKTYYDTLLVTVYCIYCMGKCRDVKLVVGVGSVFD